MTSATVVSAVAAAEIESAREPSAVDAEQRAARAFVSASSSSSLEGDPRATKSAAGRGGPASAPEAGAIALDGADPASTLDGAGGSGAGALSSDSPQQRKLCW